MRNPTSDLERRRTRVRWVLGVVIAFDVASASAVWAQAGWYVTPSVSLSEAYDDNVFSSPQNLSQAVQPTPATPGAPTPAPTPVQIQGNRRGKVHDFVFDATPGLEAGYQSEPFTLMAGYKFGTEVYAKHSELNAAPARQQLTLRGDYLPDPTLTLALVGSYLESKFARELNSPSASVQTGLPVTGQEGRRGRVDSYSVNPSLIYAFDALTTATLGYKFAQTNQVGSPSSETNEAALGLSRKITELDTVDLTYTFDHFTFDDVITVASATPVETPGAQPSPTPTPIPQARSTSEDSHAITVGWARQLTDLTKIVLRGGPRFKQGGTVDPEVDASLVRKIERGDVALSYMRTQATSVGLVGSFDTQSVTARLRYSVLEDLNTSLALAYYRSSRSNDSSDVYSANLSARYHMLEWLDLFGTYSFTYQKGVFETGTDAPRRDEDIYHNIVMVGVEATQPFRIY